MRMILVVDDHDDTRNMLQRMLKQWGYIAIAAENGEAGLALLATEKPDLIIVDGMMPGMNGVEFIRLLRANEATALIPAILHTAVAEKHFTDNAMEKGANEIWIKGQVQMEKMRERLATYFA